MDDALAVNHCLVCWSPYRHRMEEEHASLLRTSSVIRYRSYWEHRVWIGDPKLLQELWQAERDGLVEKPEFPPFHRVSLCWKCYALQYRS